MSSLSHPIKGGAATRLIVLLAAIAGAALTAGLGFWQLGRAQQKDAIQAAVAAKAALPALDAAALQGAEQVHRLVELTGRWRPETLLFLENRPMSGRAGFVVITALELADGRAVLVQRGWQPRDLRDRTLTQPLPTPADQAVRLRARVALPPSRLLDFEGGEQGRVRQNVDLSAYAREFSLRMPLDISLQQLEPTLACMTDACDTPQPDDLKRDWVVVGSSADKNRGYAVQWFSLSALIIGLWLWFQWFRPRRHRAA